MIESTQLLIKKISNKIFKQTLKLVDILNKLQEDKYKTCKIVKEYFDNDIKPNRLNIRTKKVKNDWHYYVLYMNQLYFHYKQNYLNYIRINFGRRYSF